MPGSNGEKTHIFTNLQMNKSSFSLIFHVNVKYVSID